MKQWPRGVYLIPSSLILHPSSFLPRARGSGGRRRRGRAVRGAGRRAAGGLVDDEQRRVRHEDAKEGDLPFHAGREAGERPIEVDVEATCEVIEVVVSPYPTLPP